MGLVQETAGWRGMVAEARCKLKLLEANWPEDIDDQLQNIADDLARYHCKLREIQQELDDGDLSKLESVEGIT